MATSGQVITNTYDNSYFYVNWQQASQSVANNTTTINWQAGIVSGAYWYSNAVRLNPIYINGTQVYGGGTFSNIYHETRQLASGSITIPHNNDGTKTFNINFSGWLYSDGNLSASQNFTLNTIPRYFTRTPVVETLTINTTTGEFKWSTSETCDFVKYILDGGSEISCFSGSALTGNFNIGSLLSNTAHTLKIKARRKDSGLWSDSSTIDFNTSSKTGKIRINGEEKEATPYIRINGEWKIAVPHMRINNEWKRGR